jgi:hypothetical protein
MNISLEEIKSNWTKTDEIIYKTPDIKLASLIEAKTKVIAQN